MPLDTDGRESTSSSSVGGDMSERMYESEVDMAADGGGGETKCLQISVESSEIEKTVKECASWSSALHQHRRLPKAAGV
jgi:hypothetical protein